MERAPPITLGRAYAILGRKTEAIRLGEKAVELRSEEGMGRAIATKELAEIYTIVNEHEAAIEQLEKVISIPSCYSTRLLQIDPMWDPLRDDPRFQALLEKYENQQSRETANPGIAVSKVRHRRSEVVEKPTFSR
jgi:serine/threonine-protein kinase